MYQSCKDDKNNVRYGACVLPKLERALDALCFVSPAPLGLLLDLRKTHQEHAPGGRLVCEKFKYNTMSSNGYGVSPTAKSRKRAKGSGDMSGGRCDVIVAG